MKENSLETLYCDKCGSSNVCQKMWVYPNTDHIDTPCSDRMEEEDNWCNDC